MKAYITEDLPWTPLPMVPTYANFTQFNTTTLALLQSYYNQHTLPADSYYYYEDQACRVQLFRQTLDIPVPIALDSCIESMVLGLPGAVLYGPAMIDLLCEFAQSNHIMNNTLVWDGRGTCVEQLFFGQKQTVQCLWLAFDQQSLNQTNLSYTLSFAVIRYSSALGSYAKFLYRLSYTALVGYLLWTTYYKNCLEIKKILERYGHLEKNDNTTWSYYIMIGDPTAIILAIPIVAVAFTIDIISSCTSNTMAVLRASQYQDIIAMLSSFLYLSRGVWFPYLALSLLSISSKKLQREQLFANIDPTVTVFITTAVGSCLSFFAGNNAFVFRVFLRARLSLVPHHLQSQFVEDLPSFLLQMCATLIFPLLYGLTARLIPCRNRRKIAPIPRQQSGFSSLQYNPLKTRAIFAFEKCCASYSNCEKLGGSMYALFSREPKYQQSPTISFCGADCFIVCYQNGILQSRIRLSLLNAMDRNLDDSKLAVCDSKVPSAYMFNSIDLKANSYQRTQLHRSKVINAWVI